MLPHSALYFTHNLSFPDTYLAEMIQGLKDLSELTFKHWTHYTMTSSANDAMLRPDSVLKLACGLKLLYVVFNVVLQILIGC